MKKILPLLSSYFSLQNLQIKRPATAWLILLFFSFSVFAQDGQQGAQHELQQADSFFRFAEYPESVEKAQKAADIFEKNKDWKNYVQARNLVARNRIRQGRFDEALQILQTNLDEFAPRTNSNESEAQIFNIIGEVHLNKGRNDLALEFFQKALISLRQVLGEKHPETALAYNNLGLVYWNTGNSELALDYHRKALAIRKDLYGEQSAEVAASYNDIGLSYGLGTEAETYYLKALEIYEKRYSENHPKIAVAYNNLAILEKNSQKYPKSLQYFDKALKIWQTVHDTQHPNEAFVYTNIGEVYKNLLNYDLAHDYQQKALKIYQQYYGKKHPEIANTHNLIANIYHAQGDYKNALDHCQKALIANVPNFDNADPLTNPDITQYYKADLLLVSLLHKAEIWEARHYNKTLRFKDLEEALKILDLSDKLIDHIRQLRNNKNDKIALGALAAEVYENGIRVALALADYAIQKRPFQEKAFYFAEKSKSAVLLEAISDTQAKRFANIPNQLLEQEKQIKADIAYWEQLLADKPDPVKETEYRNQLLQNNEKYARFARNLERLYPEYYNLKFNTQTPTVKDIQQRLDNQTVLINYFFGKDRLYIFQLGQKTFETHDIPKKPDLDKQLSTLRNAVFYSVENTYTATAFTLYQQLFPKKLPFSVKKLVIIPDGRLGTIPFEALLTQKVPNNAKNFKDFPYLIKRFEMAYTYAATLFYQNTKKGQNDLAEQIFLCAPVSFKSENPNEVALRHSLASLPNTETEVQKIEQLFVTQGFKAEIFLRKKAQESALKTEQFKKSKYIHFATHGVVNETSPELSQIFLAATAEQKEDGNLYSGEIYNLAINADLVTLSACQTGLGKITKGEGIIGLTRALLYAGSRNVVVSLWKVADESTAILMIDFYKVLLEKHRGNFSASLRQAKINMINEGKFSKPYYWSPFVLIGQ